MPTAAQLRKEFVAFFRSTNGALQHPGNVGGGRSVVPVCKQILKHRRPFLYKTLTGWDQGKLTDGQEKAVSVFDVSKVLLGIGQWEGAWAVAQLHYDQRLKQEAATDARLHKGHPACGLALLAHALRSPSLTRHYAMLSSAGDIYQEHVDPGLRLGGLAPTLLESLESSERHEKWRDRVRSDMARHRRRRPLYLEAFLAAGWFDRHAKYIHQLAPVAGNGGRPFVEVLLDAVLRPGRRTSTTATGTRFEAAAGLVLSATPGFVVDSARVTHDDQVDLVVRYSPDGLIDFGLTAGFGLVECKSSKRPVSAANLRDFGTKCLFRRVQFGILMARAGITRGLATLDTHGNAELVRRRFQADGLTLLVLDISHLRDKSWELRGVLDDLTADHRRLVFGDVP